MWKLIVSPEFGDRMDLVQLTCDFMQRMERDLGTRLEGADAKVHCIYHTTEMVEERGRGGFRPNGFVRLRKLFENGRPVLQMEELSQSERLTIDRHHREEVVLRVTETGIARIEDDRGAGLAHKNSTIRNAGVELEEVRKRKLERHHSRDR
jgi:hypothetical protein